MTTRPLNVVSVDQRLQRLQQACREAEAALRLSKEQMEHQAALSVNPYTFNISDKVWLDTQNLCIKQPSAKLSPKQLGPYTVLEKIGDRDYKLDLPPAIKRWPVFHVD